jgi:PEGA domain
MGAEVTVDGRSIGVTPLTLDDLSPGSHRVVLQIPGFKLWATTAQVKAGSRTRVAASLEQVQQP